MLLQVDSSPIILARRLTENSNQPCSNFAVSWRGQEATPTDNKGNYPKSIEREYSFLSQFGEESKPICSLDRIVKFDREIVFFFFFFFPLSFSFSIGKEDEISPRRYFYLSRVSFARRREYKERSFLEKRKCGKKRRSPLKKRSYCGHP